MTANWFAVTANYLPPLPFSQGFCGTWLQHKHKSIPTSAPLACCPSAPGFYLHLQPGSSALSHHSFPCRSVQNQKLIWPEVFSRACAYNKDRVLSDSDSWGLACKGWTRENGMCRNFCSLLQVLCVLHHPPSPTFTVGLLLSWNVNLERNKNYFR